MQGFRRWSDGTCKKCGGQIYRGEIYRTGTERGRELADSLCPFCVEDREGVEGALHEILWSAQYMLDQIVAMPPEVDASEINSRLSVSIFDIEVEIGRLRDVRNDNLAC